MYGAIAIMLILIGAFWLGRDAGLSKGDVKAQEQAHAWKDAVAEQKDAKLARMRTDLARQAKQTEAARKRSDAADAESRRWKAALDAVVAELPKEEEVGQCDLRCTVPALPPRSPLRDAGRAPSGS